MSLLYGIKLTTRETSFTFPSLEDAFHLWITCIKFCIEINVSNLLCTTYVEGLALRWQVVCHSKVKNKMLEIISRSGCGCGKNRNQSQCFSLKTLRQKNHGSSTWNIDSFLPHTHKLPALVSISTVFCLYFRLFILDFLHLQFSWCLRAIPNCCYCTMVNGWLQNIVDY